jgi:TetR/AcrR family transcriptional regulator, cholesterol catabolism regulator
MDDPQPINKERLLDAATNLFSARGFRGTSIRDIARAMDMSISNIYHYFGNKDGLLLAILQRSSEKVVNTLREVSLKELEPLAKLKLLLSAHIHLCAEHWKSAMVFFLNEEHLSAEGVEINQRIQREVLEIYMKGLRSLEESGIVQCRDLKVLAFNILGVINWQLKWYRPGGRLSLEEVVDEIISFVLYGITGAAGAKRRAK